MSSLAFNNKYSFRDLGSKDCYVLLFFRSLNYDKIIENRVIY